MTFLFSFLAEIFFVVALVLLSITAGRDRHGHFFGKWAVAVVCLLVYVSVFDTAQFFTLAYWKSWSLVGTIATYLGIGLLWSVLETTLELRQIKDKIADTLLHYADRGFTNEYMASGLNKATSSFMTFSINSSKGDDQNTAIKETIATIDKVRYAEYLCAWILLWPGYVVSFFFARFLTDLFVQIGNVLSYLVTKLAKIVFKDSVKVL